MASRRTSAARSGVITALSLAVVTGLAAVVGVVIAREFGRSAETDGFFVAYGVFIVIVIAATGYRAVVLPRLTRAHLEGRLAAEALATALALAVVAVPAMLVATLLADEIGGLLARNLPAESRATTSSVLPWLVAAGIGQVYAGLAASALAALDDYETAALGFAAGSIAGLALILVRVGEDGIVAVAWGMALNAATALAVPAVRIALLRPVLALRGIAPRPLTRLGEFARGVSLPLALQGFYVVSLVVATGLGVGVATSFSYAFLIASALVAITASSLSLVSSAPLTRGGLDPVRAAAHVGNSAWLALAVVAGAAGVFAVAGERIVRFALGSVYGGETGAEVGRLVVYLGPWMVASVGASVTFPLLFVAARERLVPVLSLTALVLHVPLSWAAREAFGLVGVAGSLALTTMLLFAGMLALISRRTLAGGARALAGSAAFTGALAAASFAVFGLVLDALPAAALGFLLYAALLALLRPPGLVRAVAYVRGLR